MTRLARALGVLLLLIAWPAAAGAADALEYTGRRVDAVSVRGPDGYDARPLERFLEIRPGDPYSQRQVRRTLELLTKLGEFDRITVSASEAGGGLALVFQVQPKPRIRRISLKGVRAGGAPRVMAALGVVEGDPYAGEEDLTRMAEDVRVAYFRDGWRKAAVDVRHERLPSGDSRIDVTVKEGVRQRISELRFAGDYESAYSDAELRKESGLKTGDPVRESALEAARRRLMTFHRKTGYLEVRIPTFVVQAAEDGNAKITAIVQSGERVRIVFDKKSIHPGDRTRDPVWWWELRNARLESILDLESETNLTEGFAEEAADRLSAYYRRRGYLEAKVSGEIEVQPAKRIKTVTFRITPGRRYMLKRILFKGNDETRKETRSRALREQFLSQSKALQRGSFVEEDAELAANHLVNYLRSEGYASAEVSADDPVIDRAKRTVMLSLDVEAGARSHVGKVTFAGNRQAPAETLGKLVRSPQVGLREGEPLNLVYLERADVALENYYSSIGFPYADSSHSAVSTTNGSVDINFDIDESIQAYVGRIIVRGNQHTKRVVIDRALPIETGDTYTPAALKQSEESLSKLGTFSRAVVSPFAEEEPERVRDIVVGVSEANRYILEPSFGASTEDGPRIGLRAQHRNLFGTAKSISLRAQANWRWDGFLGSGAVDDVPGSGQRRGAFDTTKIEERVIFTYQQPTTFTLPIVSSATTSLFEKSQKRTWGFIGNSLVIASSREFRPEWKPVRGSSVTVLGRYSMFLRDIQYEESGDAASVALEREDLPLQPSRSMFYYPFKWKVASLSAGALLDRRDDRFNPTRGYTASVNAELAAQPFGSDVEFGKLTASLGGYRPLPASFALAGVARTGYGVPLFGSTGIPIDQRFHVGGTGSVRGFSEGSIGPHFEGVEGKSTGGDLFALYNLELRRPLIPGLEWVVFQDTGWSRILKTTRYGLLAGVPDDRALQNPLTPSTSVGVGLRARTPVGPIKFDVGIDTRKIPETKALSDAENLKIHFTIGDF